MIGLDEFIGVETGGGGGGQNCAVVDIDDENGAAGGCVELIVAAGESPGEGLIEQRLRSSLDGWIERDDEVATGSRWALDFRCDWIATDVQLIEHRAGTAAEQSFILASRPARPIQSSAV